VKERKKDYFEYSLESKDIFKEAEKWYKSTREIDIF
jgi:hypothetical protein